MPGEIFKTTTLNPTIISSSRIEKHVRARYLPPCMLEGRQFPKKSVERKGGISHPNPSFNAFPFSPSELSGTSTREFGLREALEKK